MSKPLAYATLLGSQLAIGAAAIFARFALTGTGPLTASALRLAIAAVPVAVFAMLQRPRVRLDRTSEAALACAGVALAFHFGLWLASLEKTTVAVSTLLVCTTPLWTGVYESVVRKQRMPLAFWCALGLALAGLALVVTGSSARAGQESVIGHALALGGSVAIGVYLTLVRDTLTAYARHPARALPVVQIVARTYAVAAIALACVALAMREAPPAVDDTRAWGGIIAMALISQLLGHTGLNSALRSFPPSIVAMSTLAEPVFAAFLAALLFKESLGIVQTAGGLLVLAAIGVALRDGRRPDTNELRR